MILFWFYVHFHKLRYNMTTFSTPPIVHERDKYVLYKIPFHFCEKKEIKSKSESKFGDLREF